MWATWTSHASSSTAEPVAEFFGGRRQKFNGLKRPNTLLVAPIIRREAPARVVEARRS